MATAHEIAFKLLGQSAGLEKTFDAAAKALSGVSDSIVKVNQQAAKVDKVIRLRTELEELEKQVRETENPTKQLTDKLNKKREALKDTEEAADATGKSIEELKTRYADLTKVAEKATETQKKFAKANELQQKFKNMASAGTMGMASTAAAAAPVVMTVKAAMDYEDMQAELGKFSDESGAIFEGIKNLTGKYSKSAADMTAMAANAMQSGIAKTKDDVLELVESQTQAAVAFGMTGDAVGEAWASIQSKMGTSVAETKDVFDIVNKLGNETSASSEDILNVLQRQGGAVKSLTALNEKQVAALAGAFRSASTSSEVAATSMGTFVSRLTVGSAATKAQQDAFDALGLNAKTVAKQMTSSGESTQQTIQDVFARINKLSPDKRGAIIGKLFGNEAGIKAAVATLSANGKLLGDNMTMIGNKTNYAGSMFKEYMARANTTSEAMGIARNQITTIAASIGQSLLPTVKTIITSFISGAQKVASFIAKNQELVSTVLKVVSGLLAAKLAFHGIQTVIGLIGSPLMSLYKAFLFISTGALKAKVAMWASTVATKAAAAAQWLMNTSIMGCPIMWIIAGIAALVAAGVLLYKNWDVVKAKCVQLWAMFSEKFPNLAAIAKGAFNLVVAGAKWLWAGIKWAFSGIMSYLKVLWTFWSNVFTGIWNAVKVWFAGVKTIFTNLLTIFDNIIGFIKNVFTGNWKGAWENIKNIFGAVWSSLVTVVKTPINAVISLVNGAISGINKALGKVKIPDWVPGLGGKGFSFNIPQIPKLADGGIATSPTLAMIGEGRESEAVLPLSKLGAMLSGGTGGITVNFAPVINVSGGGNVAADVRAGIQAGVKDLERELEKLMQKKRRLSYI